MPSLKMVLQEASNKEGVSKRKISNKLYCFERYINFKNISYGYKNNKTLAVENINILIKKFN